MDMIIRRGTERFMALLRFIQGKVMSREERGLADECVEILRCKGVLCGK